MVKIFNALICWAFHSGFKMVGTDIYGDSYDGHRVMCRCTKCNRAWEE